MIELHFQHATVAKIQVTRVDPDHGDVHMTYEAMGAPRYPTREQIEQLRAAAELSPPEMLDVKNASVTITIPAEGLVLVEAKPAN